MEISNILHLLWFKVESQQDLLFLFCRGSFGWIVDITFGNVFDHQIIAVKGGRYMAGGSGAIKGMGWGA